MSQAPGTGHGSSTFPLITVSRLRRAFFAQGHDAAMRYRVTLDRVLAHLEDACRHHRRLPIFEVRHMDDLIHAVACVDATDPAWWDLVEGHESALVRASRKWLPPTDAIILVRRLFAELRGDDLTGVRSLRSFDGTRTLRRWLGDRLIGALNRSGDAGLGAAPDAALATDTGPPDVPPWAVGLGGPALS